MITREFATKWCNDLKFAWEKCDFQKIMNILAILQNITKILLRPPENRLMIF